MQSQTTDGTRFFELVMPALEQRDADGLAKVVREHWTTSELCDLLGSGSADVRKVVCLTLGLVGDERCAGCLAAALHDDDEVVGEIAEHALWSVWFRSASPDSVDDFRRGVEHIQANQFAQSIPPLTRAIAADPEFAEAYNQRAIAYFLMEDWPMALADCQRAARLMPSHFGALAGAGHCHAQIGNLAEAAQCYRDALAVNPRLPEIAGALARLDDRVPANA